MFEYCSSYHTANPFKGTIDCAILNSDTGVMLVYSLVNMNGQWMQLVIVPPMQFADFLNTEMMRGKDLRQMFQVASDLKGYKAKVKCVKSDNEGLLKLVRQDAAALTPADLASLETVIAEVF